MIRCSPSRWIVLACLGVQLVATSIIAANVYFVESSPAESVDTWQSTRDRFPLHKAIYQRDYDTIKALRDDNRYLQEEDEFRRWPIAVAVEIGDENAIRLLLASRISAGSLSASTRIGVDAAVYHRHVRSLEYMLKHTSSRPTDKSYARFYATKLLDSMVLEEIEIARALVKSGIDVNALALERLPGFFSAVMRDDVSYLKLMVEYGADISLTDVDGRNALDYCLENSKTGKVLMRLLVLGMDAQQVTREGIPSAARCRLTSHLDVLIEHGLDLGQTDEDGDTLLHNAVRAWNPAGIRLFIEAGIDRNATNAHGLSALDLAIQEERSEAIIRALKEK